ncbi:MAG: hypothetical protein RIR70_1997 [Pseudomonadota bacterium]|jgi:ATP synthase protein I
MFKTVLLQLVATVLAALVAGLVAGRVAAGWAALGGAVYVLPSFLFALRLRAESKRPQGPRPIVFLAGEFVKLALTLALLVAVVVSAPDVRWLPLMFGLVVALKANLFAFLIRT